MRALLIVAAVLLGMVGPASAIGLQIPDAVCDGATDAYPAIIAAARQANGKTLNFPDSLTCVVSKPVWLCNAATCSNGDVGLDSPKIINFNNSTLTPMAGTSLRSVLTIENDNSVAPGYNRMTVRDFNIDGRLGGGSALVGLELSGCGHCVIEPGMVIHIDGVGCRLAGWKLHGLYYTKFSVDCSGNTESGVQEFSYYNGGPYTGGTVGCEPNTANSYNAANLIQLTSSNFNDGRGFDINCSHNTHVAYDAEDNLGTGIVLSNITATVEFFGGHTEDNANGRNGSWNNGDTSFWNATGSAGIYIYGGGHSGAFPGVTTSNGDVVSTRGH